MGGPLSEQPEPENSDRRSLTERIARSIACPDCYGPIRRLATRHSDCLLGDNAYAEGAFQLRLFECPSCKTTFLSGEIWLGKFGKRYIPREIRQT